MSDHIAKIIWQRGDQVFSDGKYARKHSISFDGGFSIPCAPTTSIQPPLGALDATDPEEMLVAAVSSCHMMWFLDFARKAGFVVNSYEDNPVGKMARRDDGKVAIVLVTLNPTILFEGNAPTKEELETLHHNAHEVCNIANSINCPVVVAETQ